MQHGGVRAIEIKADPKCKRLLVVDDETNLQLMYQKVLSRNGIQVDAVGNALEALELIDRTEYDLLLIDVRLTPFDGLELLERLKHAKPDIPAIMITGYPSIYSARRSRELGAFDYLTKPIEIGELNAVVKRALSIS